MLLIYKTINNTTMDNIININDFNTQNVTFTPNHDKKNKRKMIFVNHNKKPILIKTPQMFLPNGLKHWKGETYPESFQMELSFGEDKLNESNNDKIQMFKSKMEQLDKLIKEQILTNPTDWVGKAPVDKNILHFVYPKSIVSTPVDSDGKEYAPRMKVKVEREQDNSTFTGYFSSSVRNKTRVLAFDNENKDLYLNESNCEEVIPPKSRAMLLIQLVNINIVNDKVYPKWKLVQAKIYNNKSSKIDMNVLNDEEEDNDNYKNNGSVQEDLDIEDLDTEE